MHFAVAIHTYQANSYGLESFMLITSVFSNIHMCNVTCSLQFMIDDSDWGVKLCSVTNDDQHTLLHVAAKKGLPVYVYYNLTLWLFLHLMLYLSVFWKNFLTIN